jgi:hypothetical protein
MATLLCSACYTVSSNLPGTLRGDVDEEAVVVGTLDHTFSRWYLFFGLLGLSDDDIIAQEMVRAAQASKANGIANLVYESHFSCLDYGINSVTCGVLSRRTYRVRGDLVRIEVPPPAPTADLEGDHAP